jgi:hypothetical protein
VCIGKLCRQQALEAGTADRGDNIRWMGSKDEVVEAEGKPLEKRERAIEKKGLRRIEHLLTSLFAPQHTIAKSQKMMKITPRCAIIAT